MLTPLFAENGGHRWQRIPPTERRGRVHTSTVTVAVLELRAERDWRLDPAEIRTAVTRDSGPGGQHRNKTESCVVMTHLPTGLTAKAAAKCQHRNRAAARALLEARVQAFFEKNAEAERRTERRAKHGSGQRGDKVRTYRVRDDRVTDHRSGKKTTLTALRAGELGRLD